MSNKPTLREKKLVTEETERCLDIIDSYFMNSNDVYSGRDPSEVEAINDMLDNIREDVVNQQPYIKYNQHLMERICQ